MLNFLILRKFAVVLYNMENSQLTESHQRFYSPGWMLFLQGKQKDLEDRYLADLDGNMTVDADKALVIDGNKDPLLFVKLEYQYCREFWSTRMQRWV